MADHQRPWERQSWSIPLLQLLQGTPAEQTPAVPAPSSMSSDQFLLLLKGATFVGGRGSQGEGSPSPRHRPPAVTSSQSAIKVPTSHVAPLCGLERVAPSWSGGSGGSGHRGWAEGDNLQQTPHRAGLDPRTLR